MKNVIPASIRTNENGSRTKLLIGFGITVAAVAVGVVLVKMNADAKNVILVLEETTDAVNEVTPE